MTARRPSARSLALVILEAWTLLLVAVLAWAPFHFDWAVDTDPLFPHTSVLDLVGNALLFVPFAVLWTLRRKARGAPSGPPEETGLPGAWRSVRGLTLTVALLSVTVELVQLFASARVASLPDIVLNVTGAALTGAVVSAFRRRVPDRWIVFGAVVPVYLGLVALAAYSDRFFGSGMRLADWDGSFEIAAGDEIGADRPYVGSVTDAYVCAGDSEEARVCARPGADSATRTQLAAVAQSTQVVEIGARIGSGADDQTGPTRIVTFSQGAYRRNVTLGQEGTTLVLRIRTTLMGPNGQLYELLIHDAVRQGVPTRVRARFDGGAVRTEIEAGGATREARHTFDFLAGSVLLRGWAPVPATQEVARRLMALLLLAPPVALLVGLASGARAHRNEPDQERRSPSQFLPLT